MSDSDRLQNVWPASDGEMARLIRTHDWASTPLGPLDAWPGSRKTIVDMMLGSQVIMVAPWGPKGILLYNDAYTRLIGPRGASALGRPVFEACPSFGKFWSCNLPRSGPGERCG